MHQAPLHHLERDGRTIRAPKLRLSCAWAAASSNVFTVLCTTALVAGCAAVKPARMALPQPLAALPDVPVQGLGAGRGGSFQVAGQTGSFQRGRDRLSLFDVVSWDRATTRYELQRADGGRVQAACRGRQTSASAGIVAAQPRPYTVECTWRGAVSAELTLSAPAMAAGTLAERSGSFIADGVVLELRSVHRVQGSPLPLAAPIGYVLSQRGTPVGAVEINGTTPRLWRPPAGSPLHEPVTLAALAMALLWDPADAAP